MILTSLIAIATCITMIIFICKKPTINFKHFHIESFWLIALIGALLIIICQLVPLNILKKSLFTNNNINPLKILVLLISISLLSITLDELGFFSHVAYNAVKFVKSSQYKLFFILYALVSILTIFTSNDIVILTFTLFICYFAKETKINPIPYLVMEFVAANTYSMMLYIGNPTNVYLATVYDIGFIEYFRIMFFPTIVAGLTSLILLLLLFRKPLKQPFVVSASNNLAPTNKLFMTIALIHLFGCTIFLAISSYIDLEMWIVSLLFASSLTLFLFLFAIIKKDYSILKKSYLRLPWSLIIFVVSMFTIVLALSHHGITENISLFFNRMIDSDISAALIYGFSSSITDNLINNIPMTLAYSEILPYANSHFDISLYATIIGSNVGAFLTPVGALAGIMWMSILKKQEIDFTFLKFMRYGIIIVIPVLFTSLLTLCLVI